MKAIKSCTNKECNAYIHKTNYKDNYVYCPLCGEKLVYVCADCWTTLEHSTEKYCLHCQKKRAKQKEEAQQKMINTGVRVAEAVSTVAVITSNVVKNSKPIVNAGKTIIKVIKR